jgi:hypothetical protein
LGVFSLLGGAAVHRCVHWHDFKDGFIAAEAHTRTRENFAAAVEGTPKESDSYQGIASAMPEPL